MIIHLILLWQAKKTLKIYSITGLTIDIIKGLVQINGNSFKIKGLNMIGTTVLIDNINQIDFLSLFGCANLKFQLKCKVKTLDLDVGLRAEARNTLDFNNEEITIEKIILSSIFSTSDSMFIDSYEIFHNSNKGNYPKAEKMIKYHDSKNIYYDALMVLSKGIVSFLVKANVILDSSLKIHTKITKFNLVFYSAKSKDEITKDFLVSSLALYEKVKFSDYEERTIVNGLPDVLALNMININTSKLNTYGDMVIDGYNGPLTVNKGTVKCNGNITQLFIFPGGILNALIGFNAYNAFVYFNPTGCGQIIYQSPPSNELKIFLNFDEKTQVEGSIFNFNVNFLP